jgi:hypothetical protein
MVLKYRLFLTALECIGIDEKYVFWSPTLSKNDKKWYINYIARVLLQLHDYYLLHVEHPSSRISSNTILSSSEISAS